MLKKYVVGVDGSPESRAALAWAVQQAKANKAALELVNVADDGFLAKTPAFFAEAQALSQEIASREVDYARESLAFDGSLSGRGIIGHPVAALVNAAQDADMLILGAHHGNRFTGSFFGTRAVKVAAAALCPVAVIPFGATNTDLGKNQGKIIVGVDGSSQSQKAIAYAAAHASITGKELHAVYAWMPPTAPGIEHLWSTGLLEAEQTRAAEDLAIATAGLSEQYPDLVIRKELVSAPAVQALVETADPHDTIIVGSKGRSNLARLLLGSVSHGVLQALACPTIVL